MGDAPYKGHKPCCCRADVVGVQDEDEDEPPPPPPKKAATKAAPKAKPAGKGRK
jgi:hypothetical protein